MPWFAICDKATGRLVSTATVVADDATLAKRGLEKHDLGQDNPQVNSKRWNEATRRFDNVMPPRPALSLEQFWGRFTVAEREDLLEREQTSAGQGKKKLAAFRQYLTDCRCARLDDPYVVDSVNLMETAGLIGSGRASEILA